MPKAIVDCHLCWVVLQGKQTEGCAVTARKTADPEKCLHVVLRNDLMDFSGEECTLKSIMSLNAKICCSKAVGNSHHNHLMYMPIDLCRAGPLQDEDISTPYI